MSDEENDKPRMIRDEKGENEEISWFLHSFGNPPTDPLTLQLLALVEDLPSLPGPQTVGSENYSRIFDAFVKGGWAGFEREFDRIVPRDRADYKDVKQDLLRESLFNRKGHRNIVEALLGTKAVDKIFDEMDQQRQRKPQECPLGRLTCPNSLAAGTRRDRRRWQRWPLLT